MASMQAVMLTKKGGPEVLERVELPLPEPGAGELRVRVLATGVGSTDVTMRRGYYPYAPPIPFVPGYESVGVVEAIGAGVQGFAVGDKVCALLVHGGYATHVVRAASEWVHVPAGLEDAEVAALILNYVTAWQMIHRVAKLQSGQSALVTAAASGVGLALIELLRELGVRVFAAAGQRHHELLRSYGAEPIEGREPPVLVPEPVDAAFDGVGGEQLRDCMRATRPGGVTVWYGFMGVDNSLLAVARNYMDLYLGAPLRGRRAEFYGITALYRKDPRPLQEDLPRLFELLKRRRIQPRIAARLPLLDAREANARLEQGGLAGKIVLVADEQAR